MAPDFYSMFNTAQVPPQRSSRRFTVNPTIRLIQSTFMRFERENEAQHRLHRAAAADFAAEKPVRSARQRNNIKQIFKLLRRRP
jgi:hypothetical protein